MIEVQHVDFISIPSRDLTRSKQFYGDTLGLPVEKDFPGFAEVGYRLDATLCGS